MTSFIYRFQRYHLLPWTIQWIFNPSNVKMQWFKSRNSWISFYCWFLMLAWPIQLILFILKIELSSEGICWTSYCVYKTIYIKHATAAWDQYSRLLNDPYRFHSKSSVIDIDNNIIPNKIRYDPITLLDISMGLFHSWFWWNVLIIVHYLHRCFLVDQTPSIFSLASK